MEVRGDTLVCPSGDEYPIVDGIPVLVRGDVRQTLWVADESIAMAKQPDVRERAAAVNAAGSMDEEVQRLVASTCGYLYEPLIGNLKRYPIPELRLPDGAGRTFVDIGCGWGRWSVAAARKGYAVVSVDPSLRHLLAARRVCQQLGVPGRFVVADARYLPFAPGSFDVAFSYSVLQHFAKSDVRLALRAVARSLRPGGESFIQMPNVLGVRSIQHQIKRRFRPPENFDVRRWTPGELRAVFGEEIGETTLSVDGFFGLGIQPADIDMLPRRFQLVVRASEALRRAADRFGPLLNVADSLYVRSIRRPDIA